MLRDCQAKANGALWLRVFAGNVRAIGFYIRLGFHIRGEAQDGMPVSYTHLDVYKRQGQRHSKRGYFFVEKAASRVTFHDIDSDSPLLADLI